MSWEAVIGLEVHVQLATDSKIFSGSSTAFGAEPNTQACPVDLALPGTLPVFNEKALEMAVRFGLAIGAHINHESVFDRKNYFYPDLPKGYQISQLEAPIVLGGTLSIDSGDEGQQRTINLTRAHLEEDAGKSLHEDFHGMTGIDLNRAGTPLLEIVSEPELRSAKEAVAYLRKLHTIITYLGISDGDMSQGSMRCDCNVSVRKAGSTELGTRTETKNVNSFKFVEKAINGEIERQIDILEDGGSIDQETRLYDADKDETRPMRSKEFANDYRYFPDPDLLPVVIDDAYIQAIRESLPELPEAKAARFQSEHGLSEYDASLLTASRQLADFFEATARTSGDAKLSANWLMGEVSKRLNQDSITIDAAPITPEQLGGLIARICDNTISGKIAKTVFDTMWAEGGSADEIIEKKGLKQVTDSSAIEGIVDQVIAANPAQVEQYQAAEPAKRGKMIGFFVGQVMQASKGKANPQQVNSILKQKLPD